MMCTSSFRSIICGRVQCEALYSSAHLKRSFLWTPHKGTCISTHDTRGEWKRRCRRCGYHREQTFYAFNFILEWRVLNSECNTIYFHYNITRCSACARAPWRRNIINTHSLFAFCVSAVRAAPQRHDQSVWQIIPFGHLNFCGCRRLLWCGQAQIHRESGKKGMKRNANMHGASDARRTTRPNPRRPVAFEMQREPLNSNARTLTRIEFGVL